MIAVENDFEDEDNEYEAGDVVSEEEDPVPGDLPVTAEGDLYGEDDAV